MLDKDGTRIVAAKELGALMLDDACQKCFWIKQNFKLPWQIFPGIFSSIDSYTKKAVHAWFDHFNGPPPWIPAIKNAVKYLKVPHWSKFYRVDENTGIKVRTVPDDIFEDKDGCHIIPDYKTAKLTDNQDKLLPMYRVQQNMSAWIERGFGHQVIAIPLVYWEPLTSPDEWEGLIFPSGFDMAFVPHTIDIEIDPKLVEEVLEKAHDIISSEVPPPATDGCKDCEILESIISKLIERYQ